MYTIRIYVNNCYLGLSWINIPFPSGSSLARNIFIRGIWPEDTEFYAVDSTGNLIFISRLNSSLNYLDLNFPPPNVPISGLRVQSSSRDGVMRGFCYSGVGDCKTISITEVAVQSMECFEQLAFDLGSNKLIHKMDVKFTGFVGGMMATSLDDSNYVDRMSLMSIPSSYFVKQSVTVPNITARYIRFRYVFRALMM